MIKAVLIDIDNTLLDFNKSAELAMIQSFNDFGGGYKSEMFSVFKKINDRLWKKIENKELTQSELYKIRWNIIFNELNVQLDGESFEKHFLEHMKLAAEPVDFAPDLLCSLSKKYVVCAASNAPLKQQLIRLERAGMLKYLKFVFSSEGTGHNKPSTEFFDECFRHLNNILPEETIIIGDSLSADINGGARYGMKTCWFNYKNAHVPSHNHADFVVDSLKTVMNIL